MILFAARLAIILMALGLMTCKQKAPTRQAPDRQGGDLKPSELCQRGGATFDSTTNVCVCAEPRKWDGNRCVGEAVVTKESCEESGGSWQKPDCTCPAGKKLAAGRCADSETAERNEKVLCKQAGGEWDEDETDCNCSEEDLVWDGNACVEESDEAGSKSGASLREFCDDADGTWSKTDEFCYCSGSKVIFINRCKIMKGRLTDDICKRARTPGIWRRSRCLCPGDQVFIPNLGGCTERIRDSDILENICEDSLNGGVWDESGKHCRCPGQKIWFELNCVAQEDLSSRDVCESDFNKGKWDRGDKDCICPVGTMWIDQSCKRLDEISSKDACESEKNGGEWSLQFGGTCICPGRSGWIENLKICDTSGVTPAQQLCIQSGGRPEAANRCLCPSGFDTATLREQGYQYCVKGGNDDEVPLWLLILLGIL